MESEDWGQNEEEEEELGIHTEWEIPGPTDDCGGDSLRKKILRDMYGYDFIKKFLKGGIPLPSDEEELDVIQEWIEKHSDPETRRKILKEIDKEREKTIGKKF